MSEQKDPTLDNCTCCEVEPAPSPIFNPPGQPVLRYRIDTQPTFLQRMIDALPHQTVPPDSPDPAAPRPLAALTARAPDDASIALLDAWAVTADVLTFYQERIANEGYLRTATDRRSLLELAREIGYELSPGVAAGVELAFTVESAVGAPRHIAVPIGTKVLSVPGPGEVPQTFETIEAIDARPEWNAFPPRRADPELVLPGMTDLFLDGIATQLQVGDALLFVGGDRIEDSTSTNWDLRTLSAVELDAPNKRTRVAWTGGLNTSPSITVDTDAGTTTTRVFAMRKRAQLFGHNAIQFQMLSRETKVAILAKEISAEDASNSMVDAIVDWDDPKLNGSNVNVEFNMDSQSLEAKGTFDLDIVGPKIGVGSWIAPVPAPGLFNAIGSAPQITPLAFPPPGLMPEPFPLSVGEDPVELAKNPGEVVSIQGIEAVLLQVTSHPVIISRSGFGMTSTVTRVQVDNAAALLGLPNANTRRREIQLYVESEELTLGLRPVIVPVDGREEIPEIPDSSLVALSGSTGNFVAVGLSVQGLTPNQKIALVGKRPNVQVVDTNTLALRAKAFLRANGSDVSEIAPLVAQLQALMQPPADSTQLGGLILDDPPGVREPLSGHTFELLAQIEDGPDVFGYKTTIPTKIWKLRSRTGASGTATLPFFAVDTVPAAPDGETIAEVRRIAAVFQGSSRMLLQLDKPLTAIYDRGTLTISANVATATHGETVASEALGNGDPAVANQTFELKKPPLTYTSAPDTPSGSKSTLGVRVNGIQWREVAALFGAAPDDQIYTVRRTNDGQTDIIFGDGTQGSRLPTGTANIVASYRTGIGLDGQVAARTLSLLTNRPLGVRSVINPLGAAGAATPAAIEDARANAPLAVRTIDRVVSVTDVEDFARSFAGIGKSQARLLWDGRARVVQLTVGGADGRPIAGDSQLLANLTGSLRFNADPSLLLRLPLDSFDEHDFSLKLQLDVDGRFVKADVQEAVRRALLEAFSFAGRSFGQSVSEVEILALVQSVPGVLAANVAALTDEKTKTTSNTLSGAVAHFDKAGIFVPATLLLIDPAKIDVSQSLTP